MPRPRAGPVLLLLLGTAAAAVAEPPVPAGPPPAPPVVPAPAGAPPSPEPLARRDACERASLYLMQHGGLALLVQQEGRVLFEAYAPGRAADSPHRLASGTKSFWGLLAAAAVDDGLLTLDEPVARTITEWQGDPRRSRITIRQLLSLTSGLEMGTRALQDPRTPDKYAHAVGLEAQAEPGSVFRYGPGPFYVFGELLRRKLLPSKEDPLDYLKRRLLGPLGLVPYAWSRDAAGRPDLPHGAALTAREWAKLGEWIRRGGVVDGKALVRPESLAACFVGSAANPGYGLTFWLPAEQGRDPLGRPRDTRLPGLPADAVLAAGLGGQKLLVARSAGLVVVVQAELDRAIDEARFWGLLSGRDTSVPEPERPLPRPAFGEERLRRAMTLLDRDGDGCLSLDEVPATVAARFEDFDTDLDGLLSDAELRHIFEALPLRPR